MARRRRSERRDIRPDPRFRSVELARFANRVMKAGKKTLAQRAVYDALDRLERETNRPGIEVFEQALRNVSPVLEVKPRRVGGATYQVPVEVRPERRLALAMRWIIAAARNRAGSPIAEKLSQELLEASRGQGTAVRRRDELHRMAEANRAFVHYRW
ncbi:MAG: 30S ribosomal protein S7 [Gemmatimonadetes bacterium]|nr:30S ribosomal protein S7 [Gemmatimonadota bacterium]